MLVGDNRLDIFTKIEKQLIKEVRINEKYIRFLYYLNGMICNCLYIE